MKNIRKQLVILAKETEEVAHIQVRNMLVLLQAQIKKAQSLLEEQGVNEESLLLQEYTISKQQFEVTFQNKVSRLSIKIERNDELLEVEKLPQLKIEVTHLPVELECNKEEKALVPKLQKLLSEALKRK